MTEDNTVWPTHHKLIKISPLVCESHNILSLSLAIYDFINLFFFQKAWHYVQCSIHI